MPARTTKPTKGSSRHLAVFPGSFDPVTYGHLDVIRRGRRLFDELVVAVGRHPGKDPLFTPDERVEMLEKLVAEIVQREPGEARVRVEAFGGLTVDFARRVGATVLLRGIRNLSDLQNEVQQALTNRQVAGLETFYRAENYHQGYFRANPRQPYCQAVVAPKVAKLRKHFLTKLKTP